MGCYPSLLITALFFLAQSTTYIIGYANKPIYQFQYQWFIIEFEFCIFALTAFLTLFPKHIARGRPVALTFISTALVLVLDNVNAIWCVVHCAHRALGVLCNQPARSTFLTAKRVDVVRPRHRLLLRTPIVDTIYEYDRIKLAQAGLIMVGVSNGLTIIFMGLYEVRPAAAADRRAGGCTDSLSRRELSRDLSAGRVWAEPEEFAAGEFRSTPPPTTTTTQRTSGTLRP